MRNDARPVGLTPVLVPRFTCPHCGSALSTLERTRLHPNHRLVRRRRHCSGCHARYWTRETVEDLK